MANRAKRVQAEPAELFKTELCPRWLKGCCEFGEDCKFAHGEEELRPCERHEAYKTMLCKKFGNGYCRHGKRCRYAHGAEELTFHRDARWCRKHVAAVASAVSK